MKILKLNLKRQWWEQIRDGVKTSELRLVNDYWTKRLVGKEFDIIELCLGYPKKGDMDRIFYRHWNGFTIETITHEEFGPDPVEVFAIDVHSTVYSEVPIV